MKPDPDKALFNFNFSHLALGMEEKIAKNRKKQKESKGFRWR